MTPQSKPLLQRARAAGFLIVAALSACTPLPSPGYIQTFRVNPRSELVVKAAIVIPVDRVPPRTATYYMKTNHGETSKWRALRSVRDGATATVVLVPKGKNTTPKADDAALVYFEDPHSRQFDVLPPAFVMPYPTPPPPQPLVDPDFSAWTGVYPNLVPAGWTVTTSDRASFDIRPFTGDNRGVQISIASTPVQSTGSIATPIPAATATVNLLQPTVLTGRYLRVEMRPFQPCIIENGKVIAATGIEATTMPDVTAERTALFCVGPAAYSGPATIDGQPIRAFVVRGHVGQWNDVRFDVSQIRASAERFPVSLSLVAALDPARSSYDWITMDVTSLQSER
ncbi:MAG TPA: hypothetical protein VGZ02_04735 [Candidatus Baltobacteraceae bacterium]|jgi:hypothetical protein|nr:hypothetical protein [Candidatus Baltobacteraceae bacterium]